MRFDNPWWTGGAIPQDLHAMRHRLYLDLFYPLLTDRTIRRGIILMGPRRVGKTVMLFHAIEKLMSDGINPQKIIYFSIDTPIYNNLSLEELFMLACETLGQEPDSQGFYVIYDEIQYLKDWEIHLKSLIDSYRQCLFIASGSAAAALKMKSNESGAGRFTDFMLPPLSFNEYIHLLGHDRLIIPRSITWNGSSLPLFDTIDIETLNQHFVDYINFGGYPEIVFSQTMRQDPGRYIRQDIVDKVLLRDLPSLYGIQDTQELNRLFVYIAYRSGGEFSIEALSKESEIRKEVLKKYLMYLEAAFLIKVIHKVDVNAKRMQRITTFKIYLTNPSLRCALFSPLSAIDSAMGGMVETAIFAQWIQRSDSEVCYANWKQGRQQGEVDMVGLNVSRQQPNWVVEIKWTDRYAERPGELHSLLQFMVANHIAEGVVTSISSFCSKQMDQVRLQFLPSSLYAYIVGWNTISGKQQSIGL